MWAPIRLACVYISLKSTHHVYEINYQSTDNVRNCQQWVQLVASSGQWCFVDVEGKGVKLNHCLC